MGTPQGILALALPLALALAAFSCAFGLAKTVAAAMDGIARQPEAAKDIQGAMMLGCGFIEALAIYVLVVVLLFGFGLIRLH